MICDECGGIAIWQETVEVDDDLYSEYICPDCGRHELLFIESDEKESEVE